jgi:Carboxypeptidase regulatory-like domain
MSSLTLWVWLVLTAAASPQPFSISGTVVDPDGKPVKGATVWFAVFVNNDAEVKDLAQFETDVKGRFTFDAPTGDRKAAAAFDPRAALAMIDALPTDPEPKQVPRPGGPPAIMPRVNEKARLAVARALALPPGARLREALRVPGQPDLWPAMLDD